MNENYFFGEDFVFQTPFTREKPYSISEINSGISEILQKENLFVCIEGEISGFKRAPSGHSYLTLKDEYSRISAVIWKDKQAFIPQNIEDGMQITAFAEIKVYQAGGYYQLDIHRFFENGVGMNFTKIGELKQKLCDEGLFNVERKRKLPQNIRKIGVITAKNGAAFYDILKIMTEHAPQIDVVLASSLVQGKDAAKSLAEALENINKIVNVDVVIIGRGGGSAEDLSAFNDEKLVRTVTNSKIPVISAVGHEIDKSFCDFAADLYAPTPTAAAEMICRASFEIRNSFEELNTRLQKAFKKKFSEIRNYEQILDELLQRLCNNFKNFFEHKKEKITNYERILNALNPRLPLQKGFVFIKNESGKIIKSAKNLSIGQKITIMFDENSAKAQISEL
ncbi:MAG: exodeoxyribonuclease VII large subunit [Chitinispirillales bacterium]|jgi:exodeoxyribonuclease VII large subunit|nr:exodeoxyribonuclease VII large subunit [Chitinispirillales bacterium]